MLMSWAILFLVISVLAGLFGFTGMAGTGSWIAQTVFFVFLIAFVISLFVGRKQPMV
jgi:uncharacterized membrane protein YtjA (UPF0391 family)